MGRLLGKEENAVLPSGSQRASEQGPRNQERHRELARGAAVQAPPDPLSQELWGWVQEFCILTAFQEVLRQAGV